MTDAIPTFMGVAAAVFFVVLAGLSLLSMAVAVLCAVAALWEGWRSR